MPLDPDVCPSCLRRVTAEAELASERRGHAATRAMLARAIERAAKAEAHGEDRALDGTDGAHPAWWRAERQVSAMHRAQHERDQAEIERLTAEVERLRGLRAPTEPAPTDREPLMIEVPREPRGTWLAPVKCERCERGKPCRECVAGSEEWQMLKAPCPAHTGAAVPASRFDSVSGPVPEEDDDGA